MDPMKQASDQISEFEREEMPSSKRKTNFGTREIKSLIERLDQTSEWEYEVFLQKY